MQYDVTDYREPKYKFLIPRVSVQLDTVAYEVTGQFGWQSQHRIFYGFRRTIEGAEILRHYVAENRVPKLTEFISSLTINPVKVPV